MTQTTALLDTLKKQLRVHGKTYRDLAAHLQMSEANVKSMFSKERITLSRLEAICQLIDLDLTDLIRIYEDGRRQITHLTLEQESELAANVKLLLAAVCVRNQMTYQEILGEYDYTEHELTQILAKLDKLKIIDLLPGNRIKLRITTDFRWLARGPIDEFFEQQIKRQFLNSKFLNDQDQKLFLFGLLSEQSIQSLNKKITDLAQEVSEMHRQDANLPLAKRHNVGMLLAMREWELDVFQPYRKTS